MDTSMQAVDVLNLILNTPELFKLLVPDNITAYGIMWGGSRFLGFDDASSDYDINIIVSPADYTKMEAVHKLRPSIYINDVRIHWYYCPTSFRFFNFEFGSYSGLYWWTAALLQGITKDSFIKIYDETGIEEFLQKAEFNLNLMRVLIKDSYHVYYNHLPRDINIINSLWKKSYLPLYIASLINGETEQSRQFIYTVKTKTANIEKTSNNRLKTTDLDDDVIWFIIEMAEVMTSWTDFVEE